MKKIDPKNELKHLYAPGPDRIEVIDVPPMNYLMIDGRGDPNQTDTFKDAIEALFAISYTLKYMVKQSEGGVDYLVMPLEGLFSSFGGTTFNRDNQDKWQWTLMIMQPDYIDARMYAAAAEGVLKKKALTALPLMRFDSLFEGLAAQIMHLGLFAQEGPTIKRLHEFITDQDYTLNGRHHEIYLSDIRKASPDMWRTIIRLPITKMRK